MCGYVAGVADSGCGPTVSQEGECTIYYSNINSLMGKQ